MFLVPKRIYFAVREAIGEDDKVKHLDRLNNDTNYIEKAIQFGQQKSYKSQQEDSKNSINNIEQTASIEGKSLPDGNNEELSQDGSAPDTASGVSPPAGPSFIFPPVNHSEQENVQQQQQQQHHHQQQHLQHQHQQQHREEISLLHRGNATENLLDNAPHSKQPKPSINLLKKKIDVRPKLRCSFCKATYARSYFLMEHLRKKHNYRPSLGEERSAREALEKAKIGHDSIKAKEPLPSFRGKRKNVDDEDESDIPIKRRKQICKKPLPLEKAQIGHDSIKAKEPLPSFRGKRKNVDDDDESDIPLKRRKQICKKPLPSFRGKRKNLDDVDESDIPLKRRKQVRKKPSPSKQVRKKPLPSFRGKRKNTNDTDESNIPPKRRRQVYLDENEPLSNLRPKLKNKPLQKNPFYKKPLKAEQRKELLPAQVKVRKLNIRSNPFFKKFPKLLVRKF